MADRQLFLLACERCRKRKQKCDRVAPACGECTRAGTDCIRSSRESDLVRSSTSGTLQLKGPITLLQEKLAALQSLAQQRGLTIDDSPVHDQNTVHRTVDVDATSPIITEHPTAGPRHHDSKPRHAATRHNTHRGLDLLSLGAMAEPTRRTGEMLRELSIPRIIFAVTEVFGGDPEQTRRVDRLWDCVAREIKKPGLEANRQTIPRTEAFDCLNRYFQLVDYRYPSLSRKDVEHGMNTVCGGLSVRDTVGQANPATSFVALMVIALVPLVTDDFSSAHGSFVSIHMLSRALQLLEDIFRIDDGIEIIQCLRLLVVYSLHTSAAGSSWHLIGFAMNKCVALGYHLEPQPPETAEDEQRQEKNRWVFWSCYLLDRLICTALGRPYSLDDAYVSVKFPGETSGAQLSGAASRQIHLFRYARLMSDVVRDHAKHPFRHHLSRLLHWRSSAPEQVEPYPPEQTSHLKSIYDSLLLRAMIDQIVYAPDRGTAHGFDHAGGHSHTSQIPPAESIGASMLFKHIPTHHGAPPQDSEIYSTCQAVISSLTRSTMRDRAFLSWLTGYTAFSAAVVLLYLTAKARCMATSSPSLPVPGRHLTSNLNLSPSDSAWYPGAFEEDPLQGAISVMSIVGRQFARIAKYKSFVVKLHGAIFAQAESGSIRRIDTTEVIDRSGPDHLQRVIKKTLSFLEGPGHGMEGSRH